MPVPQSETYGKQTTPPKTTSALQLTITRIIALWPRKVFVQWILRNPVADTGYTFEVYRSGSPTGPWEQITPDVGIADTYFFVDDSFQSTQDRTQTGLMQLRLSQYYRVTVRYQAGPTIEAIESLGGTVDHRRAGIVRKLTRDAYIAMRKGNGTEVAVLKRRWYGDPCPLCRSTAGVTTRGHCSTCNGTGIIRGYWNPVYTFARRTASPLTMQTGVQGIVESNRLAAHLPAFPEVDVEDILVFLRDGRRYIIENVNTTEIHTVPLHQECNVSELARTSREYAIVVDPWHDPEWF